MIIYPGLDARGTAGIRLGRAVPANRSDPDLARWRKARAPVATTGGDGPSAAWLNPGGERRMLVGAGRARSPPRHPLDLGLWSKVWNSGLISLL